MYILFEIWNIVTYQMLMFNNFDNCTIIFKKYYFLEFKIFKEHYPHLVFVM